MDVLDDLSLAAQSVEEFHHLERYLGLLVVLQDLGQELIEDQLGQVKRRH